MKALIIGATGATGKDLVTLLLNDDAYIYLIRSVGPMSIEEFESINPIISR